MGRTPIGEKKISNAEKQKQYHEKQDREEQREKDRIKNAISCENLKKRTVWNIKII